MVLGLFIIYLIIKKSFFLLELLKEVLYNNIITYYSTNLIHK